MTLNYHYILISINYTLNVFPSTWGMEIFHTWYCKCFEVKVHKIKTLLSVINSYTNGKSVSTFFESNIFRMQRCPPLVF